MAGARQPRKQKAAPHRPLSSDELRRQAEERLDGLAAAAASPEPDDLAAAVHELRVHQIELEVQNEELRRAQLEIEEQRAKYFELFELAPVGYLTVNAEDIIGETNVTAAHLLGVERQRLVGQPFSAFVLAADQEVFYRHHRLLEKTGVPQTCELRLQPAAAAFFWARLESRPQGVADGAPLRYHLTFIDVHERVAAEEELHEQLQDTVKTMGAIIGLRDPYTAAHEGRVTTLAAAIALELGLGEEALEGLAFAGEVHDIGKVGVPAEILSKPAALNEEEFALIKRHSQAGRELLGAIRFRQPVAEIVGQHHERLDGSGYPDGLKGDEILPEAGVLAVADVVEAMASHRPYRAALGLQAALAEVRSGSGRRYDAVAVAACERVFAQGFAFTEA